MYHRKVSKAGIFLISHFEQSSDTKKCQLTMETGKRLLSFLLTLSRKQNTFWK